MPLPDIDQLEANVAAADEKLAALGKKFDDKEFVPTPEAVKELDEATAALDAAREAREAGILTVASTTAVEKMRNSRKAAAEAQDKWAKDYLRRPNYDPTRDTRSGKQRTARPDDLSVACDKAFNAWVKSQADPYALEDDPSLADACARLRVIPQHKEFLLGRPWGTDRPLVAANAEQALIHQYHAATANAYHKAFQANRPERVRAAIAEIGAVIDPRIPDPGGYTARPPEIMATLEFNMLAYGGILQAVDSMTTSTGERMTQVSLDDTSNKGVRIGVGAGPGVASVDPHAKLLHWDYYKYSSKPVAVVYEMFRDALWNPSSYLGPIFGERLGRIISEELTLGNGAGMPKGLVTAATLGVTTAAAGAITYSEMLKTQNGPAAVDPAYRTDFAWMFHDNLMLYLRDSIIDGVGRTMLELGQEAGRRDRMFGAPIYINLDMDSALTTGKKTILYGQFRKYLVRRVGAPRFLRDDITALMSLDSVYFASIVYADGNLRDYGTAPVKYLKQL